MVINAVPVWPRNLDWRQCLRRSLLRRHREPNCSCQYILREQNRTVWKSGPLNEPLSLKNVAYEYSLL